MKYYLSADPGSGGAWKAPQKLLGGAMSKQKNGESSYVIAKKSTKLSYTGPWKTENELYINLVRLFTIQMYNPNVCWSLTTYGKV